MDQTASQTHSTAEIVAESLIAQGIDTLFALPGMQNDPFFAALFDRKNRLRVIHSRHEQGVAYMSTGAAMATGAPSAYCVVPGPGFLNTTAALATAYGNNAQVLALVGQIPSRAIGKGYGFLHEIPDQLAIMAQLTKSAHRVTGPEDGAAAMEEAFRLLLSGRPRPVGLEVPMDVWKASGAAAIRPRVRAPSPAAPDAGAIAEAAKLLNGSRRPLIVVGGGAQHASTEVTALATLLQAPVVAFRMGRGVLDARSPFSVTFPIGHRLWKDTDLVIGIGTKLQQLLLWGQDEQMKVVRIDIDPEEITRHGAPAVGIEADSAAATRALVDALSRIMDKRASREDELRALKAEYAEGFAKLQPQMGLIEAMREALPEEGIFVDDLTQVGYVGRFAFPVYRPRSFISTGYQGTLGWSFATALGVKAACPDRPVLSITGDGGFFFNVQELSTAVRHRLNTVTVVFNDGAFGNVQRMQEEDYDNRVIATDLHNPDLVKLAELFGARGVRAETPDKLKAAIREGFAASLPTLIDVPMPTVPSPWQYIQMPRIRGAR